MDVVTEGGDVECVTGYHGPTSASATGAGYVRLTIDGVGAAAAGPNASYSYVDLWSQPSSWGGNPPPTNGDTVVIPEGQSIVLDISPPYLYMVVVMGNLTFDRRDIELNTSYIFVQGGSLTIGTEDEPFTQRAIITLHGSRALDAV